MTAICVCIVVSGRASEPGELVVSHTGAQHHALPNAGEGLIHRETTSQDGAMEILLKMTVVTANITNTELLYCSVGQSSPIESHVLA